MEKWVTLPESVTLVEIVSFCLKKMVAEEEEAIVAEVVLHRRTHTDTDTKSTTKGEEATVVTETGVALLNTRRIVSAVLATVTKRERKSTEEAFLRNREDDGTME